MRRAQSCRISLSQEGRWGLCGWVYVRPGFAQLGAGTRLPNTFVRGNRLAKCYYVPEILQEHRMKRNSAGSLASYSMPLSSRWGQTFFGSKSGEAEQIIGTVFNHIYSQVVAGINLKFGAVRIS